MSKKKITSNLLDNLNEEQAAAVLHKGGPLMIVAGAGTGKTTVITKRIAWLIEKKLAAPENILALTFTEKAAAEMEERVDLLLPYGYIDIQISTFHAFCERILRDYGVEMGLSPNFKLVSELDAWLLARANFERFELDYYRPLGNPTKYLRSLLSHFSRAKDEMVLPDDYLAYAESEQANLDTKNSDEEATMEIKRLTELAQAYHVYQQILLANDSLDFGDLILYTLQLLQKRPRVLKILREKYKFILVDEFQDTNWAQYELVKLLAAPENNLTVVGDDDQSVYAFRGTSLFNILRFETDYPDCARVVLTKNYRSGQKILDSAYEFIQKNNPNRLEGRAGKDGKFFDKRLSSQVILPGQVEHLHYSTVVEETRGVAEKILLLKEKYPDANWSDFGILVRANSAADDFISAFERYQIPYQFMALRGLYIKPIILDIVALLEVVDNPYQSPSLYRLLAHDVFKISPHDLSTLNHFAKRKGRMLYDACRQARAIGDLSIEAVATIEKLLFLVAKLADETKRKRASEIILLAAKDSGLLDFINKMSEAKKQENFRFLHQFHERVKKFESRGGEKSLHAFLDEFRHEREAGEEGSLSIDVEAGPDLVKIMTVHGAKGLEFRFVFIVNLIDRRFPTSERKEAIELPRALIKESLCEGDFHLEEERRLFYVAMTRAKEALYFTSAEDYGGARKRKLSRFLNELGIEKPDIISINAVGSFIDEPVIVGNDLPSPYRIPKQLSFTQLRAFETCPLQYKFAHILEIPVFESWSLSFGKTMHNTLQAFFQLWLERTGSQQVSLFGGPKKTENQDDLPVGLDELLKLYKEKWLDDWYQDDKQRREYFKQGEDSLKQYFIQLKNQPPQPKSLEQGFTLKVGEVSIRGRIDRIDDVDGGVEVIDYKTGTPKTKLEREDREQLLIYQLAVEEILRLKPIKLTYHYLNDNSEQSFIGTAEELSALKEQILADYAKMKASDFTATPGFHCKFCDFRDICEFRSGE
ncbi:MAG: ATP-dependent DNA helicase [Candidatus Uhrbacteria bacterium]